MAGGAEGAGRPQGLHLHLQQSQEDEQVPWFPSKNSKITIWYFLKNKNRVLKHYHDIGFVDVTPFSICGEYSNDRTTRKYVC